MKHFLLILIFLTNFLAASAAEYSCISIEDSVSHSQEANHSIEKTMHHDEDGSADHKECHHTCSQCHFAALVPRLFNFKAESVLVSATFFSINDVPRNISQLLYRPPIS